MAMMPKRVKYRKSQRGKINGVARRAATTSRSATSGSRRSWPAGSANVRSRPAASRRSAAPRRPRVWIRDLPAQVGHLDPRGDANGHRQGRHRVLVRGREARDRHVRDRRRTEETARQTLNQRGAQAAHPRRGSSAGGTAYEGEGDPRRSSDDDLSEEVKRLRRSSSTRGSRARRGEGPPRARRIREIARATSRAMLDDPAASARSASRTAATAAREGEEVSTDDADARTRSPRRHRHRRRRRPTRWRRRSPSRSSGKVKHPVYGKYVARSSSLQGARRERAGAKGRPRRDRLRPPPLEDEALAPRPRRRLGPRRGRPRRRAAVERGRRARQPTRRPTLRAGRAGRRLVIQMQTMLDVADNTGAKLACASRCSAAATAATPTSATSSSSRSRRRCPPRRSSRARSSEGVIVRTRKNTRRADGSYVRFDRNAIVLVDEEQEPARARASSAPSPASCARRTS